MLPSEAKKPPTEPPTRGLLTRPLGVASTLIVLLLLVAVWAPLPWQTYAADQLAVRVALLLWVMGLGTILTWSLVRHRCGAREWIVAGGIGLVLGAAQTMLSPDAVPGWPSAVEGALPPVLYTLLPLLLMASLRVSTHSAPQAIVALALALLGGLFLAIPFGMLLAGTSSGADVVDGSLLRPALLGSLLFGAASLVCRARLET